MSTINNKLYLQELLLVKLVIMNAKRDVLQLYPLLITRYICIHI